MTQRLRRPRNRVPLARSQYNVKKTSVICLNVSDRTPYHFITNVTSTSYIYCKPVNLISNEISFGEEIKINLQNYEFKELFYRYKWDSGNKMDILELKNAIYEHRSQYYKEMTKVEYLYRSEYYICICALSMHLLYS